MCIEHVKNDCSEVERERAIQKMCSEIDEGELQISSRIAKMEIVNARYTIKQNNRSTSVLRGDMKMESIAEFCVCVHYNIFRVYLLLLFWEFRRNSPKNGNKTKPKQRNQRLIRWKINWHA